MSNTPPPPSIDVCANCGKGEENSGNNLKACTACKMVKYCNRDCQIAHRPQHKKACKKRAAELYDKKLFKENPPEECPICMLPPPLYDNHTGMNFHSCCGKRICSGCVDKMEESGAEEFCAFCRTPYAESDEEVIERLKKLIGNCNGDAFEHLAGHYADGSCGMPQDRAKANELYLKAGELGCAQAYYNLGVVYRTGRGVEIDEKKATHYWELAAMNGDVHARNNLGALEKYNDNHQKAVKHFIISAKAGVDRSLGMVKNGYMDGHVTKEQYAKTLREHQTSQDEMKSDARDKAWAARNERIGG